MDESVCVNSIDTSRHGKIDFNSHCDSGYLTSTPQSTSHDTSLGVTTRSARSLLLSKRHHHHLRSRLDPIQCERFHRHRAKINRLDGSDDVSEKSSLMSSILEHSSPTKDDHERLTEDRRSFSEEASPIINIDQGYREFGMELRNRVRRNLRSMGDPVTPPKNESTRLHLLSPPPSPMIPTSSIIDEDVEMKKLVIVSQSTPCITVTSPPGDTPPIVPYSPTSRRKTPIRVTSTDNHNMSRLAISESDIKPKKLDFNRHSRDIGATHAVPNKRAIPDYTGTDKVDVLTLLGEKSNHWRIVSKIMSQLSAHDLCSVSMVCQSWRRICMNDPNANSRRQSHVILRQNVKENLKQIRAKSKVDPDIPSSPKSRYARKGCLLQVQNLLQPPKASWPPGSPPVSPSKVRFNSFVKASRKLAPWEHLLSCPSCSFPSHVNSERNVGTCTRQGCLMEFCVSCSSKPHTGPCKTPLLVTPTKRNKTVVVGSRQSKRNLRRL